MMKVIVDMNMSRKWAAALRDAGFEAWHWNELGPVDAPDETIMSHALDLGCIVLTRDMDFSDILSATGALAPSVILHRNGQRFSSALVSQLVEVIAQTASQLASGAVVSLREGRARIRPLPLGRRMDDVE